jgi:hypothetical protein
MRDAADKMSMVLAGTDSTTTFTATGTDGGGK